MKYPQRSPYISCEKIGKDEYVIENVRNAELYYVDSRTAAFLKTLDGKNDPYDLLPECRRRDVRRFLKELGSCELLMTKNRFTKLGMGSFTYALASNRPGKAQILIATIINYMLMLGFIPMLAMGIYLSKPDVFRVYIQSKSELFWGITIATVLGVMLHELAHACAGIAYDGDFIEMGVGIQSFMPIGYVLMDLRNVDNKYKRIQFFAAGLEMDLLLYGAFMCLSTAGVFNPTIMELCGKINLALALLNMLPLKGFDGMQILSMVFEKEDLLEHAKMIINNRKKHLHKPMRSAGRAVAVAASYGLVGFQIVYPMLLLFEAISFVRLVFL